MRTLILILKRCAQISLLLVAVLAAVHAAFATLSRQSIGPAVIGGPDNIIWQDGRPIFGGLSGLLIDPSGTELLAVSDRGSFVEARLIRVDGHIDSVIDTRITPVSLSRADRKIEHIRDLESLTRMPDGSLGLAFERVTRIATTPDIHSLPVSISSTLDLSDYMNNQAFEALATFPNGDVIAIPERRDPQNTARYRLFSTGLWHGPFDMPRSPGFVWTGADVGPDGCLYGVERRFDPVRGFRFRVSRLWKDTPGLSVETTWQSELLYQSKWAELGNAEGISAWQDTEMHVTLVTDNNFLSFSPTRLIEFTVAERTCG